MQGGTLLMLAVCVVWFGCFVAFTARDLQEESKKTHLIVQGKSLDPFLFSGEKARKEASVLYQTDPVAKKYFKEIEIEEFLGEKTPE